MGSQLYCAPAASGKTAYVLNLVREVAQGLAATPRVIVPTWLQVRSWERRLAEAGGAIGVRVMTFDRLYVECLSAAGEAYTELSEPVQYRLVRAVVDELPLRHYAPLVGRPGFVQELERLIGELKAGRIMPDALAGAIADMRGAPRLQELAQIYDSYQLRLQAYDWADRAGLGWLAVEALEERTPQVARDWPLLVVDGFDSLTPVQLALIKVLAGRVSRLVITLTSASDGGGRPLVYGRFNRLRQDLERALGVSAVPLPEQELPPRSPSLAHLEGALFDVGAGSVDDEGAVQLIAASDRAAEVRAALRWLKRCLVEEGMRPGEVALLARQITPYRPFIVQTAAEFGLPVRLEDGLPLRSNPAVVALLDLLRLALPRSEDDGQMALPRRGVVEAWRSPYFDWSARLAEDATEPIGIGPEDAEALDAAARWGMVIGGLAQWNEALADLASVSRSERDDDELDMPEGVPIGAAAEVLKDKFARFVERLSPPAGPQPVREYVVWLEALIGPDPAAKDRRFPLPQ